MGGGTLAPGGSAGTTSIEGDYNLNDGSLQIEIGGVVQDTDHDFVNITGALNLTGGTLDVVLIDGFIPAQNDAFDILDFDSVSGNFSDLNLPDGGLVWDTSQLLVDGTISLISGGALLGDMDCDGDIDFDDIDDFVLGLQDPQAYEDLRGIPPTVKGDTDGDGDLDFDDITGFVELLSGSP